MAGKKGKKPFFKRVWFWIVLVVVIMIGGNLGSEETAEDVKDSTGSEQVSSEETGDSEANKEESEKESNEEESNEKESNEEESNEKESNEEEENVNASEQSDGAEESMTTSQKNAVAEAENYLEFSAFSKQGLIDQLSSDYGSGYPQEDAEFAVDQLNVDWKEQALESAESYLDMSAFSEQGLKQQLTSEAGEQFTEEQAQYAIDQLDFGNSEDTENASSGDSNGSGDSMTMSQKNAVEEAKSYLEFSAFSKQGLIDQLSSDAGSGYPKEDAEFAVNQLDVDWKEQAVKDAENYLETMSFSRDRLIQQLSSDSGSGFTREQAEYAVNEVGL